MPRSVKIRSISCLFAAQGCTALFANRGGLSNHLRTHRRPTAGPSLKSPSPTPVFDEPLQDWTNEDLDTQPEGNMASASGGGEGGDRAPIGHEKIAYHPRINGS